MTIDDYLHAYDTQLRGEFETPGALTAEQVGPLRLVRFPGGLGFITHRHFDETDPAVAETLVESALAYFRDDPTIRTIEWKVREHDHIAGLDDALRSRGFVAGEVEAIMVGPVSALADADTPDGVVVRRLETESDVREMSAMIATAFDEPEDASITDELVARLTRGDGMELWVAEVDGRMVSGGRLEPVAESDFVGIWGGATLPEFRGRGIYRAVTAARARSAVAMGKTLVHSDSSPDSRPILERSGLVQVSTTTPWEWRR